MTGRRSADIRVEAAIDQFIRETAITLIDTSLGQITEARVVDRDERTAVRIGECHRGRIAQCRQRPGETGDAAHEELHKALVRRELFRLKSGESIRRTMSERKEKLPAVAVERGLVLGEQIFSHRLSFVRVLDTRFLTEIDEMQELLRPALRVDRIEASGHDIIDIGKPIFPEGLALSRPRDITVITGEGLILAALELFNVTRQTGLIRPDITLRFAAKVERHARNDATRRVVTLVGHLVGGGLAEAHVHTVTVRIPHVVLALRLVVTGVVKIAGTLVKGRELRAVMCWMRADARNDRGTIRRRIRKSLISNTPPVAAEHEVLRAQLLHHANPLVNRLCVITRRSVMSVGNRLEDIARIDLIRVLHAEGDALGNRHLLTRIHICRPSVNIARRRNDDVLRRGKCTRLLVHHKPGRDLLTDRQRNDSSVSRRSSLERLINRREMLLILGNRHDERQFLRIGLTPNLDNAVIEGFARHRLRVSVFARGQIEVDAHHPSLRAKVCRQQCESECEECRFPSCYHVIHPFSKSMQRNS